MFERLLWRLWQQCIYNETWDEQGVADNNIFNEF